MTKHFFKSDFSIREHNGDYETHPFEIVFWAETPSQTYKCSWDGTTYTNCEVDATGSLVVNFGNHNLGVGILKAQKTFYVPDANYIDGIKKLSSVGYYDVRLTMTADDVITIENTDVAFFGSTISFPSGKASIEDGETEMLNDIDADVDGSTLILNI